MLVVAANWLISDGSVSRPPSPQAVNTFLRGITRCAARAGLRRDGRYEPVREIALVLAGDTFDRLASRHWLGSVKPWHPGRPAREIAAQVDEGILQAGRRLIARLARLVEGGLEVPAADRRGRPDFARRSGVGVRLVILEGDMDRGLAAAAVSWESRRRRLFASHRGPGIFSFGRRFVCGDTADGDALRIDVRHGDEFDPCCQTTDATEDVQSQSGASGHPTLAESIRVDLFSRFARGLSPAGDEQAARLAEPLRLSLLRVLAACRPLDLSERLGAWLREASNRGHGEGIDAPLATFVRDRWRRAVDDWQSAARIDQPSCVPGVDVVDAVAERLQRFEPSRVAALPDDWLRIDRGGVRAAFEAIPRGSGGPDGLLLAASPGVRRLSPPVASHWLVLGHPPLGLSLADGASVILLGDPTSRVSVCDADGSKAWGALEVDPSRDARGDFSWAAIDPGTSRPVGDPRRRAA